jgi:hypothetical protein
LFEKIQVSVNLTSFDLLKLFKINCMKSFEQLDIVTTDLVPSFYLAIIREEPVTKTENIKTDATKILRPTGFS